MTQPRCPVLSVSLCMEGRCVNCHRDSLWGSPWREGSQKCLCVGAAGDVSELGEGDKCDKDRLWRRPGLYRALAMVPTPG